MIESQTDDLNDDDRECNNASCINDQIDVCIDDARNRCYKTEMDVYEFNKPINQMENLYDDTPELISNIPGEVVEM